MTYTATVTFDTEEAAGSWTVTIDGHPGAVTFVRRLTDAEVTAAEALGVFLERHVDPDEIKIGTIVYPGLAGKLAAKARSARAKAEDATEAAQAAVAEAVHALAEQGLPSTAIGPLVGVSPQRVQQLLAHGRSAAHTA
jgi:hypothetical protein